MSTLHEAEPVKPVASIFSADRAALAEAARRLEERTGCFDYVSEESFFDRTDYYEPEMGSGLVRRFFAVEELMDPMGLVGLKVFCAGLETELSVDGRRRVNIDPGYVSPERLLLATGKNFTHRVYLGRGVYGDLTLMYQNGCFQVLPWTYPDYATEIVRRTMADIRAKLMEQLRRRRQEKR